MYLNSMPVLLWKWKASNMATVMFVCKQWHKRYDLVFPTSTSKWFLNFNFHHDVEMSHVSSVFTWNLSDVFCVHRKFPDFFGRKPPHVPPTLRQGWPQIWCLASERDGLGGVIQAKGWLVEIKGKLGVHLGGYPGRRSPYITPYCPIQAW